MTIRTKSIAGAGVILTLTVAVAALFMREAPRPVGRLSQSDVIEIRAVVRQNESPRWSWFTRANLRDWPTFLRSKLTFRILDIREDSIGRVIINPDGTREEPQHPVTVWFRVSGSLAPTYTCRVQRSKGRWVIAPVFSGPFPREILLLSPNPRDPADAGFAFRLQGGSDQPGTADPGCSSSTAI